MSTNQSRPLPIILSLVISCHIVAHGQSLDQRHEHPDDHGHGIHSHCPATFFELMSALPGPDGWFESEGTDISSDGKYVVGDSASDEPYTDADGLTANHPYEAVGWTRPCERVPFLHTDAPGRDSAGLTPLGYLPSSQSASFARGISPDGRVVLGFSYVEPILNGVAVTEAAVWDRHGNKFGLGKLTGDVMSIANDSSDSFAGKLRTGELDSSADSAPQNLLHHRIVIGYSSTNNQHAHRLPGAKAVYWGPGLGQLHQLAVPDSVSNIVESAEAIGVSDDGTVIAGNLYYGVPFDVTGAMPAMGCVWTWDPEAHSYGKGQLLRNLAGPMINSRLRHISGNGAVIVGSGNDATGSRACLWRRQPGPRSWSAPINLGLLAGSWTYSIAMGSDYWGRNIVGVCGIPSDADGNFSQRATIWKSAGSGSTFSPPQDLIEILHANGSALEVDDHWNTMAVRISNSDNRITGDCWHPDSFGIHEGWVGAIP
jgi:uncharacterized membrane protein